MKLAKADLVPTDTNLLAEYGSFAELEAASYQSCLSDTTTTWQSLHLEELLDIGRGGGRRSLGA